MVFQSNIFSIKKLSMLCYANRNGGTYLVSHFTSLKIDYIIILTRYDFKISILGTFLIKKI